MTDSDARSVDADELWARFERELGTAAAARRPPPCRRPCAGMWARADEARRRARPDSRWANYAASVAICARNVHK